MKQGSWFFVASMDIALLDALWAMTALLAVIYPLQQVRGTPGGGGYFACLLLIFAIYPALLAVYHLTPFDLGLVYGITVFAPPLYFIIMTRFLNLSFARSFRFRSTLLLIAAGFSLCAITNPWHGFYGVSQPHVPGTPNHLLVVEPALGMQLMYAYMLTLVALVTLLALHRLLRARFDWAQLTITVIMPMLAGVSLASSERFSLFEQLGVSGIIFITTAFLLIFNVALLSRRVLEVRPVSRSRLMDLIPDAMAVVGPQGTVVDCNDAFAAIWNRRAPELIDEPLASELQPCLQQGQGEVCIGADKRTLHFDTHTQKMGGRRGARMLLLRDITDQVLASERLARSRAQLRTANGELERLSTTDSLTGLRNRRYFLEQLDRELARVQRGGQSFGLIAIDIDRFKQVNDHYGHAAGDEALMHVARVMENQCRVTDTLARMGGEEFMVLAVATDDDALLIAAERMRAQIERHPITMNDGCELTITASLGIVLGGAQITRAEPLLQAADAALYEAKRQGRNRTVVAADFVTS